MSAGLTAVFGCSLCGELLSPGALQPGDAACPKCKLTAHHRAIWSCIALLGSHTTARKIVVCGAGAGEREKSAREYKDFISTRTTASLELAADVENMDNIPTGDVNILIAPHVLQYAIDDQKALATAARVLHATDGEFVFTVPYSRGVPTKLRADPPSLPFSNGALPIHEIPPYRHYGLGDLRRLLQTRFALTEFQFTDSMVRQIETVFHARPHQIRATKVG